MHYFSHNYLVYACILRVRVRPVYIILFLGAAGASPCRSLLSNRCHWVLQVVSITATDLTKYVEPLRSLQLQPLALQLAKHECFIYLFIYSVKTFANLSVKFMLSCWCQPNSQMLQLSAGWCDAVLFMHFVISLYYVCVCVCVCRPFLEYLKQSSIWLKRLNEYIYQAR